MLAAGGTGGHVFPARSLAEELIEKGYRVALATDTRGLKYFNGLDQIPRIVLSSGAYRSGIKGILAGIVSLAKGYIQSHGLMSRLKPAVVIGFGGYPSAPPLSPHSIVAFRQSFTNKMPFWEWPIWHRITGKKLRSRQPIPTGLNRNGQKCVTTGNPVRQDISELAGQPFPR